MYTISELKSLVEQSFASDSIYAHCNNAHIQVYENRLTGGGIQFNVRLLGNRYPTIKFEERMPGRFTVAVAPEDGASIDYTQSKAFTMDEPLEHLTMAFPQSTDIKAFVSGLTNN